MTKLLRRLCSWLHKQENLTLLLPKDKVPDLMLYWIKLEAACHCDILLSPQDESEPNWKVTITAKDEKSARRIKNALESGFLHKTGMSRYKVDA
jgi:hypothetical protein